MKSFRLFLLSFFMIVGTLAVNAQDIHFSQFYLSPLNLNPALTGVMNCNIRLTANYRNQWASVLKSNAFNTYSVSYDQRIPVGRYDYFGVGGTFWGDKAGQLDFKTLTAKLSASYSKRMGGYADECIRNVSVRWEGIRVHRFCNGQTSTLDWSSMDRCTYIG